MNTTGSTVLVTGGGSGIGRGLAEALHAAGHRVIVAGRRRGALEAVAAANPGMAFRTLDADDPGAIRAFAAAVVAEHPALDVLVNNAGIMRLEDLVADPAGALADAEATITTNLLGPLRLTAALLPHLLARPSATIINVTSGLAFVPRAAAPAYSATKAAMHSYTQSLRHQLRGTGVRVVELAPPLVATALTPGQEANPMAMPLAEFLAEATALLRAHPMPDEALVERVKRQRFAEAAGTFDAVFAAINPA